MPEFSENLVINDAHDILVRDGAGHVLFHWNTSDRGLIIGGSRNDGDIYVEDSDGNQSIHLGGEDARLELGHRGGNDGDIFVNDRDGNRTIHLGGNDSRLDLGGHGNDGDVFVRDKDGNVTIHLGGEDSRLNLGGHGNDGDIFVKDRDGNVTIKLGGDAGDIFLRNADCAEDFDTAEADVEPGTVMSLGEEGRLRMSREPYDPRVAGVVSGAGGYDPGIVLDKQEERQGRIPIALMGKVMCRADASNGPIRVGDMLTTSGLPGSAMRIDDPARAFGAVIGKALGRLTDGDGLIPVLASLR